MSPSASAMALGVDRVFLYMVGISALVLAGITAAMVLFVVRYRRERRPIAEQIEKNTALEVAWTVIPTVIFLTMFFYGWSVWREGRGGPAGAAAIRVTGRQFAWSFTYPGGKSTPQLVLPLGRPVRLDVGSADVVHGFFVPAFRLKVDAVPGRTNYTWVTPTQQGAWDVECTSMCGASHSFMLSKAHVVAPDVYDAWVASPGLEPPGAAGAPAPRPADPAARGKALAADKGCTGCHSDDGSVLVGPSFKGIWGRREPLESGKAVVVDHAYLVRSIRDPSADVVKGFPDAMPQVPLADAEIEDVIAWLETLK